jgi:protein-S-isoprenylcysteine O-methyltransferase Ste14
MTSDSTHSPAPSSSSPLRRVGAFLLVLAGVIPSFLFFVWLERNMALPWVGPWLARNAGSLGSWPLVFVDLPVGPAWLGPIAWNLGLIAMFGFAHSVFAGDRIARPLYVAITGAVSLAVMAFWQPTGVVVWQLIPSAALSSAVSVILFWGLHAFAAAAIAGLEPLNRFLGLAPVSSGSPVVEGLRSDGWYGRVRHPAYTLTLLAWILAPMMSLDRIVFIVGMGAYLAVGIRLEERRLVVRFGDAYRSYRARVPALFPKLGR